MIGVTRINTRSQTASIAIPTVLLVLLIVIPAMQHSIGITVPELGFSNSTQSIPVISGTNQAGCTPSVNQQTQTELKSINAQQAKSLATQNSDFQSRINGYGSTFDSIFVEGAFDPSCTVVWKDINVVYDLTDSKGQYVKHIITREDPLASTVLGVSEQVGAHFADFAPQSIWSGYQFWYYSNPTTLYPVWETTSSWLVPTVYYPTNSTHNPACNSSNEPWCDAAVWNGLQDSLGSSGNKIVQGGSDSNMTCTSSTNCTKYYYMWYEFLINANSTAVHCPNITVNAGDNITSDIIDSTKNSTATSSQYVVSIQDTTTNPGVVCGAQNYNFTMNYPKYADYVIERNEYNNLTSTLANFSSTTMSGTMYYNNSYNSIQAPVNAQYFGKIPMEN